ncbi:hypothetical protein GALMADRAFT_71431 [Galerina marginata CBS 339.88]|uniref:Uncharacterized protein n=1 Tax=Galerina marginata (strain CBS 339.88) TaxID=685588 RepID=A0A067ST32_GALM3|nr:hypothetical protein GALMADRAFT_71431 [Galerina marginata CBS 339.88]
MPGECDARCICCLAAQCGLSANARCVSTSIDTLTCPEKAHDRDGFKGLWRRVKPFDKPDEAGPSIPFYSFLPSTLPPVLLLPVQL